MNKVALKSIGFVEQNEATDEWMPQDEPIDPGSLERSEPDIHYIGGIRHFQSIDQAQASLKEELNMDGSGSVYHQHVQFAVRTEADRALVKKYERRPLVLYVETVDGEEYQIGTKDYPAYIIPSKTKSRDTVETALTVDYDTTTPVM